MRSSGSKSVIYSLVIIISVLFFRAAFGLDSPVWTGNGPWGGYIHAMASAPSNPDIVYAATRFDVYSSQDGGLNWTEKSPLGYHEINDIEVAPDNPDIVYLATDDGLYKTGNGGLFWSDMGYSEVNAVAINPNNPGVLFIGLGGDSAGVYISIDAGENWEYSLSTSPHAVVELIIDPDSSDIIYAGVKRSVYNNFFRSTNNGENWESYAIGDNSYYPARLAAVSPASDSVILYAITPDKYGYNNGFLYKSYDRGQTWASLDAPDISPDGPWALTVDPANPDIVYAGSRHDEGDVFRSIDGGATWEIKSSGFDHGASADFLIHPVSGDLLVGLGEGGVYRSADQAENWFFSSSGLSNTGIMSLAIHPDSSNIVWAGAWGSGHRLCKSTDGGETWNFDLDWPCDIEAIYVYPPGPDTVYAGFDEDVKKSTDGGLSWQQYLHVNDEYINDVWVDPTDPDHVLVATYQSMSETYGVWVTFDNWSTWVNSIQFYRCRSIAAHPRNPDRIYVGTQYNGNLFYSNSGGLFWDFISPEADWVKVVYDIDVDLDGTLYAATDSGLFIRNGGEWHKDTILPHCAVYDIELDTLSYPSVIYVGTWGYGVHCSYDGGASWIAINEGLPSPYIYSLDVGGMDSRTLYTGTAFDGVFKRNAILHSELSIAADPVTFFMKPEQTEEQYINAANTAPSAAMDLQICISDMETDDRAEKNSVDTFSILILTPDEDISDFIDVMALITTLDFTVLPSEALSSLKVVDLLPYDVVLTTNGSSWWEPEHIGNILADFLDAGGKLITCEFAYDYSSMGYNIAGRFLDESYGPLTLSTQDIGGLVNMGTVYEPGHPVMQFVSSISTSDYHQDPGLAPGAVRIADWDDGTIMLAANNNVVGINMLLSWGDGHHSWLGSVPFLIFNSVKWLASMEFGCTWLTVEPVCDTVSPGTFRDISITASSSDLTDGSYSANLAVYSNDPAHECVEIPVTLIVSSQEFLCGDANGNASINVLDIVYIINYLYKDGPSPDPIWSADVNGDISVNIQDVIYFVNYLYKSGPAPECGN